MKLTLLTTRQKARDAAAIWHVLQVDGKTVCGRAPEAGAVSIRLGPPLSRLSKRICKACDLMKGASTMRLA